MKEQQLADTSIEHLQTLSLAEIRALRQERAAHRPIRGPELVPRAPHESPALSFAQERLWFLDQLGLVGAAYNMRVLLRLSGRLNEDALKRSLAEVVRRHESLRAHFESTREGPVQVIDAGSPLTLELSDLSALEECEREAEMNRIAGEEVQRPFDLVRGPLFRVRLLRLAPREHVLLLTLHHIVADGWSLEVLNRELGALYGAYSTGRPSPLSEPVLQYADYALWQRKWLQGEVLHKQLQYWSEQLAGAPPELRLPTDRPRPAVASFKGAVVRFELPSSVCTALERLAREQGATLFMVLLAAYQLLLSRHSGQRDIVVGSAIAGRTHANTEELIGFFINTLILRADLTGNPTFKDLLARVKEATLGAYAHQDLPFEKLVKELRPERNLSRQPVFQAAMTLHNFPQEPLQLAGVTWTPIKPQHATALFDLTLQLFERPEGLLGELEYATDLFDRETIERMAHHFQTLLSGVIASPDCHISQLRLLSEAERRLLLQWHGMGGTSEPGPDVVTVLEQHARLSPEAPAAQDAAHRLSYRELNEAANRVGWRLRELGVRPRERVGVCMDACVHSIVAFYAILKIGAVYVPLDPAYPAERLQGMCRDADVDRVLVRNQGMPQLASVTCIGIDGLSAPEEERIADHRLVGKAREPTHPAYVIFTSGSTGRPKGVLLHRSGLANVIAAQRLTFGLSSDDCIVQLASVSFDASVFEFMLALGAGACLFLGSREELQPGRNLTGFLAQHSISVMTVTPSALSTLLPRELPALRTLVVAGEELPAELARTWLASCCRVFNAYGPTETTIWATTHECSVATIRGRVPIGRPINNAYVHVVDQELQSVAIGEIGELCVGGAGVGVGYLNRPDLTRERFIEDPVLLGQGKVYRTGDLVRWNSDGTLEFVGRADNQVKIRGFRIEPSEVEAVLLEHPSVRQAAVLAREDVPGEQHLVAYIVGDPGGAIETTSDGAHAALRAEIVEGWETLYEDTYSADGAVNSPHFIGWNSSYTGLPIPEEQMSQWLTGAVERIDALAPHKVLEIGCGVGLVLQRLAPRCECYVGTDLSASALHQLRCWMAGAGSFGHVQLHHRAAIELEDFGPGSFDTVVLNSVVQYFPDIEYLLVVLRGAVRVLQPGGKIFIGDVRHAGLLPQFHSSVQLSRAASTVTVGELRRRIARAISQEKELAIDPEFFESLPGHLAGIGSVEVNLKQGPMTNELTCYRYDVVLTIGQPSGTRPLCETLKWPTAIGGLSQLQVELRERRRPGLRLCAIPNLRLARDERARQSIEQSDERLEVGALRRELDELDVGGVPPDAFWALGEALGYSVAVSWTGRDSPGSFDVQMIDRLAREPLPLEAWQPVQPVRSWSTYGNDPLENTFRQRLIPQLREYLKARLPDYMMPALWVGLPQLPLTPSGKLDRHALPAPQARPDEMGECCAPRTELERRVTEIWMQVLRVNRVGVQDNFFELGGHSLLATRVITRIREQLSADLPVRALFDAPTVEQLCARIQSTQHDSDADRAAAAGDAAGAALRPQIDEMGDEAVLLEIAELERQLGIAGTAGSSVTH